MPSVISSVLTNIKEITTEKKSINVRNGGKPLVLQLHFKYVNDPPLEKKLLNVDNVVKHSVISLLFVKKKITTKRNPMHVRSVEKSSDIIKIIKDMKVNLLQGSSLNIRNVKKPSYVIKVFQVM